MKKQTAIKTNASNDVQSVTADAFVLTETFKNDMKSSLLVVSLMVNLVVFTAWLVIQSTNHYDAQLMSVLFTR